MTAVQTYLCATRPLNAAVVARAIRIQAHVAVRPHEVASSMCTCIVHGVIEPILCTYSKQRRPSPSERNNCFRDPSVHSRSALQISRREALRINFLARLSMSTFTCTHDALDDAMHVHIEDAVAWVRNGGARGLDLG